MKEFDDLDLAELLDPPLTGVWRPMEEQGVLAMKLLRNRIERGNDAVARTIRLDTRLVVRRSSAPPEAGH
jgi:LacI family transcriptional regulator